MVEQIFNIGHNWLEKQEYIFQLVDAIIFLFFFIFVLYLFVFAFNSTRKAPYTFPKASKKYRYAILFPAYMEDEVIIDSVRSFLNQDYPRDLYEIIVISNMMSDQTNLQLQNLNIKVIKMNEQKSFKVRALREAVKYMESQSLYYDNIVILDADNVVKPDYLDKINDAFYCGCSAIQTHRIAKNRDTNTAVLDAVSEEINNSIFRKGHTRLGFSSGLSGSGMAFEYDIFKDIIQDINDIGEDKYMERRLLLQNIYIEYLENVYTFDEKVRKNKEFYNQRQRWLSTQFSNLFSGLTELPSAIFKGYWDYCDKIFQWMMPPRILLLGFITLLAVFLTIVNFTLALKWWGLLVLLGITLSIAIPDYLVDRKFKKAILSLPFLFILMFLNLFRLKGGKNKHIHTKHSNLNENSH
ncbi:MULTISPECIES: glycosyltransferase [Parabacteroides]|uniref:glycosyltransferase n=1 Tax=Parabacteroides provencensis TaxID=1944636 RepID=UPI000C16139A|nr:glycosyltransferase family 2 protein [Parabacteroides provencensis]